MTTALPSTSRAVTIQEYSDKTPHASLLYDAVLVSRPVRPPRSNEVVVRITAAGFNHKDWWIRKGQYPAIAKGGVFGGDGAGLVVASGAGPQDPLLNRRVFLVPTRGWKDHPEAPESRFAILGGAVFPPSGTFAEYITVERDQLIESPSHLDDVEVAALPIGGVTAWRAVHVNAKVENGQNVLITGIGGGVALLAMQICLAKGANVFVTSGSEEKIRRAVGLGAKGGANYKEKDWPAKIGALLGKGVLLDAVIDSAGGNIINQAGKVLKQGGRVVCYGMTAAPSISFTMRQVLANQQLIGSTMGSHKDMQDFTDFVSSHKIKPVISHVLDGLESAEEGFDLLKRGDQFGKVIIKLRGPNPSSKL